MLPNAVLEIADRWWAGDFACKADALHPATTHVQRHAGRMIDATGIWILVVDAAPVVSLPPSAFEPLAARARSWTSELVADPSALAAEILPLRSSKVVGPAFIGYGTEDTLDLGADARARVLTPDDAPEVERLRQACTEEAWDHGGSDPSAVPCFGVFDRDGTLRSLAGYKTWGEAIAHIAIVSAPDHQGRGHGSAAVAHAARHALDAGLLPQYRTLAANAPSMGIAKRIGFERYGYSVYVRLPAE